MNSLSPKIEASKLYIAILGVQFSMKGYCVLIIKSVIILHFVGNSSTNLKHNIYYRSGNFHQQPFPAKNKF